MRRHFEASMFFSRSSHEIVIILEFGKGEGIASCSVSKSRRWHFDDGLMTREQSGEIVDDVFSF